MAVQRRILVGIEDIRAVRLECKTENCGREFVFPADSSIEIPLHCTGCKQKWSEPATTVQGNGDASYQFLNLISRMIEREAAKEVPFRIVFEFADPG